MDFSYADYFLTGPGAEIALVKVGTAFEAATHYGAPLPDFDLVARAS